MFSIHTIDWIIIAVYLTGLIALAIWLSRGQFNREDYYVGGRGFSRWPVSISIMATQCSTNSILGAPAFVAFAAGGGLVWLQYELAVPLAMAVLILFVFPMFRSLKLVSIYEYLERRFDIRTRLILSGTFMFVRAFATSVTVYSIAIVIDLITGIGFFGSVVLLGVFTVIYDVLGGIKGVIYSDVLQMAILVAVLILVATYLLMDAGGFATLIEQFSPERTQSIVFHHHGLGDDQTFAFWPMLLGGFFLYISYYGFDQSQAQRVLSTKNSHEGNYALFYHGILRFPLVALYCFVGVGIAVFADNNAIFLASLPQMEDGTPNVNLAVPAYMATALPAGLTGLGLVALFAAAMSSLDSVLNSLSATTMEDYIRRFQKRTLTPEKELWLARAVTTLWGILTLTGAFFVEDIAPTVLESINKIGSLINGPVLGVFAAGILSQRAKPSGVIFGLLIGFLFNCVLWIYFPSISWLWWNVFGFIVTFVSSQLWRTQLIDTKQTPTPFSQRNTHGKAAFFWHWQMLSLVLILWFLFLFITLLLFS